ncbi:MAG: cyanase [Thermoleophilaceae bacterium]
MTRAEATHAVLEAKQGSGISWKEIAERVGRPPVWVTAALLGQHPMSAEEAGAAGEALGLGDEVVSALQSQPSRGSYDQLPPSDPTTYRLYEVLQVYGPTLKELIHEEFGDGIMSAINFNLAVERGEDESGAERVIITLNGKWLPYEWGS